MMDVLKIQVQVRSPDGLAEYEVQVDADSPVLSDLLKVVAGEEWGTFLFDDPDEPVGVKAGILVIHNKRMVQPWDIASAPIADGDSVRFVPVVAGG